MSQSDFGTINAATKSGSQLAADLNAWRSALHSLHKGNARPAYALAGMLWVKDATTPWGIYLFDGTDDILLGTVNATTNVFVPSFGSLSGLLLADGSGSVSAATAAQIVAIIAATSVQNALHATSADSANNATSAGTATAIADGAVASSAKIVNNIITPAKLARVGTAGQVLVSGGSGADPSFQTPAASGITSVGGYSGPAVSNAEVAAAAALGFGYTPPNPAACAPMTAVVNIGGYSPPTASAVGYVVATRANGTTFQVQVSNILSGGGGG